MKYMLLIYSEEQAWTDSQREHCFQESKQLAHELEQNGQYLATGRLQPVSITTSVRVRDGNRLLTAAPCAETGEQLGRYSLVDRENVGEAVEIAGRIPASANAPSKSDRLCRSRGVGGNNNQHHRYPYFISIVRDSAGLPREERNAVKIQ